MEVLQRQWQESKPQEFVDGKQLKAWHEDWSTGSYRKVVKILYDRDAGELRIVVRFRGIANIEKVLPVKDESELPKLMLEAESFIQNMIR